MTEKSQGQDDQHCCFVVAVHPYLSAVCVVVGLYSVNTQQVSINEVLPALLVVVGFALILRLFLGFLCRNNLKASAATTLMLGLVFSFEHIYSALVLLEPLHGLGHLRLRYCVLLWGGAVATTLLMARSSILEHAKLHRSLNLFAGIFLTLITFRVVGNYDDISSQVVLGDPKKVEEIELPVPSVSRDIYYLVFDRYPSHDTLESFFGFDNTEFESALASRGFVVSTSSRANYPKTLVSMSSALNMQYHEDRVIKDHEYTNLLRSHAVGRSLKKAGFRYFHFGNWYDPLRYNDDADSNYRVGLLKSEFLEIILFTTPFGRIFANPQRQPSVILRQFEAIERLPVTSPKFVYAHFLLPHPPFLFSKTGPKAFLELDKRPVDEQFLDQLEFTNSRILLLIDRIVQNSKEPPIIVLQADEGPLLNKAVDSERTLVEQIQKRTGILSAFLIPGVPKDRIPETTSPVNTFRVIFRESFSADLELLPSKVFYWKEVEPEGHGNAQGNEGFQDVTAMLSQE